MDLNVTTSGSNVNIMIEGDRLRGNIAVAVFMDGYKEKWVHLNENSVGCYTGSCLRPGPEGEYHFHVYEMRQGNPIWVGDAGTEYL